MGNSQKKIPEEKKIKFNIVYIEWFQSYAHVAQRLRVCLQCWKCGFSPWVMKIPWRRKRQLTLIFLPGKSHEQRSLEGYSPWSHEELDTQQLDKNKCTHRHISIEPWKERCQMFTVAISGFDNYLNFSICPMYTALLMINKSLYVSLDAYKILCFHFC